MSKPLKNSKQNLRSKVSTGLSVVGVVIGIIGSLFGIAVICAFAFIGYKLFEFFAPAL